jgi:RND family efflux transporter MFP subunit
MKAARLIVPSLILAFAAGCSKHASESAPVDANAGLPPVAVSVAALRAESLPALTEATGTVRPVQRALIAAKVMGAIEDLPVALGQRVRAGDLLVKISAGEISAKVLQAQSGLNQARRDLERERELLGKNASTADMVKGLEDRFAMTQAMVKEAEVMLGYTRVLAPFDGVVARKMSNAGDLAAPGMPLLEIEGVADFQVEAGIPDSLAAGLALGSTFQVEVTAAGASFEGKLMELSSSSEAYARTVLARLSVPASAAVRSGQFARIQIPGAARKALLAPAAAVSTLGQMERVFIVQDGVAVLRLVKTGSALGDRIEILSGLAEGDSAVLNPPVGLREGRRLEVRP